ncbi:hypothetical protein JCM10207_008601 [Rhodosporidiobolus poonsookiae]
MDAGHHQASPARPVKREAPTDTNGDGSYPAPSASTSRAVGGSEPPLKRKITRKRQVLSCRNCMTRKIRCERDGVPGQPCKACEKRGEGATCDAGSPVVAPSSKTAAAHSAGCAEHRAELERRVTALEALLVSAPRTRSEESSVAGEQSHQAAVMPDGPDSETEDAAMTLEDIAVNVRLGTTSVTRIAPTAPQPPQAAPSFASSGRSREMSSLLVPEISRRYRSVLADLYDTLPPRHKMDRLVGHYWASCSWFWVVLHAPTFLAEYDAFHLLLQEGRQYEIDPLWLSLLFLCLAHSASSLDYLPPGSDFTAEELSSSIPAYLEASRAALDCGDAFGSAKLRSIQSVVLLAPLALNSGLPQRVETVIPYVAAAVRLCQQLKLDKLGSDPTSMPPEDPALPTGTNSLRREMAIRVFHGLLHVDQTIFRCRPVLPLHLVECALPGNLDDKDLLPDRLATPHPPNIRTLAAYETLRFRVGAIQRQFHDQVILDPNYDYKTVLKLDTEMRNLVAEYDLQRPEPSETTIMFWARIFSYQNINVRLVRFHRPFMSRGYREQAFRKSTDAALAAARVVLETQKELDRTNCPLVKDCYQLNHIQVAVVVVFWDIWENHDPASSVPTDDYRLVTDASLCFHRALNSVRERVRVVARQSLLVIQCLFEALHARTASGRKEAFAQLLKRVSVAVSEAERRAALNPQPFPAGPNTFAAGGLYANPQVQLPASDPVTPDGRSLLLDVPTPGFDPLGQAPLFPPAADSVHGGSASSFSPSEFQQFGALDSEYGISWLSGGYV